MAARKETPPRALSHEDIDFLKALCIAADHVGARERERDELEHQFARACTERGIEPETFKLVIETLT